jgi:hypothetical protein
MCDEHNCCSSISDLPDEIPCNTPRHRIKSGRHLVKEDESGGIYDGQGNEESLLLTAGHVAEFRAPTVRRL